MNVLMVIAPQNFRDEELTEPMAALERAGHSVTVASVARGACTSSTGRRVDATLPLRYARARDYEAVVFVGGNGARCFFDDPHAHLLARAMNRADKIVAAICIAPVILARAGVLTDRRATVFPTEGTELTQAGAWLSLDEVIDDRNVITANGPAAATAFGERLVALLSLRRAA